MFAVCIYFILDVDEHSGYDFVDTLGTSPWTFAGYSCAYAINTKISHVGQFVLKVWQYGYAINLIIVSPPKHVQHIGIRTPSALASSVLAPSRRHTFGSQSITLEGIQQYIHFAITQSVVNIFTEISHADRGTTDMKHINRILV